MQRYFAALTWCNKAATHIYTCKVGTVSIAVENASYPTAVHEQSGVRGSVCLSVCLSVIKKYIEISPLRTVYGFKECWNKRKIYLLPFLGAGFIHMALSREC